MTRKIPHYFKYDFRLSSVNRSLYSVIRDKGHEFISVFTMVKSNSL